MQYPTGRPGGTADEQSPGQIAGSVSQDAGIRTWRTWKGRNNGTWRGATFPFQPFPTMLYLYLSCKGLLMAGSER